MEQTRRNILLFAAEQDLDYLPCLAQGCPHVTIGVLTRQRASLRLFARDAAKGTDTCTLTLYRHGGPEGQAACCSVEEGLGRVPWDTVVLSQDQLASAMYGTYNTDLEFLLDLMARQLPEAVVYLMMPWAWQQEITGPRAAELETYFDASQAVMYNGIVASMEYAATGAEARFGRRLGGIVPVGAAIQRLRETLGDGLCSDGCRLSHPAAVLTAALTTMLTLCPESWAGEVCGTAGADAAAALRAARSACEHDPVPLSAPPPVRVEQMSLQGDVTVAQATAPYKLHFPDSAVLADGTVFATAYEHVYHFPVRSVGEQYGWQGSGRLVIWKSTDNARSFDTEHPVLVIDEQQLDRWGVARTADRYERWRAGEDYILNADPRDPNFSVVRVDLNADGVLVEMLVCTFCMVNYHEQHQTHSLNLCYSVDGGESWSVPQQLESEHSPALIKRGDAAVFADGQMLVPTYFRNKIVLLLLQWNSRLRRWVTVRDTVLPDPLPEKTGAYEYNELSFVLPDPEGDEVIGFIRANGALIHSGDRGLNWRLVGVEDGFVHQPGFAPLDRDRSFVTWAGTASPRTVYGKVLHYHGHWSDTVSRVIYASPDTRPHDMADPSCRLLASGEIFTISYDTAYRSIVGSFHDPDSQAFAPVELDEGAEQVLLFRSEGPVSLPVRLNVPLPASYTVTVTGSICPGGHLELTLADGTRILFSEPSAGCETCHFGVLVLGRQVYTQTEAGGGLTADGWALFGHCSGADGPVVLSGAEVRVRQVMITHRVLIEMKPCLEGIVGGKAGICPVVHPEPRMADWRSGDLNVARVDGGLVRYVGPGEATITYYADGAAATCRVRVSPLPAEVSAGGERRRLFHDSFDGYRPGENAFWDQLEQGGYTSCGLKPTPYSAYDIVPNGAGQCLKLTAYNGMRTWHKVELPIRGDYTATFDFKFTGGRTTSSGLYPGHCLYINLWQDSGIHGFLDLTPEGIRCEYESEPGKIINDPELFGEEILYTLGQWHSIRVARVNGGIFARVWPQGQPEPEGWDVICMHREYRTDDPACFRLQYYAGGATPRSVYLDNLSISQRIQRDTN